MEHIEVVAHDSSTPEGYVALEYWAIPTLQQLEEVLDIMFLKKEYPPKSRNWLETGKGY